MQACAANTHTCSHTQMHTRMLTARRDVWRERTPAISSPVLPACSGCPTANLLSPQPVTLKSKCQPVTFPRHLTLKWSPFFFSPSPKVERGRDPHLPVSLCGIHLLPHSSLLLVLLGKSQGQIARIRHDYCNSLSPSSARRQFSLPRFWFPAPEMCLRVNLEPLTFSRVKVKVVAMCF